MAPEPLLLATPPRDPEEIDLLDRSLAFPSFTAHTAWKLGCLLRTKLLPLATPCVVDISLAQSSHCLFHCATQSGTAPDHDAWVARKRNTVLRWARSTWSVGNKFGGDEAAFAAKYGVGGEAARYAIHGGGWPVRVRGCEGVVAVVVVSGLKQEQNHAVIVQAVEELLQEMGVEVGEGEKKKED